MALLLNIFWFVFGGWLAGLLWWLSAVVLAVTIIGVPWAAAAWRIGSFSFAPFGREAVYKADYYGGENAVTGAWRILLNLLWFVLGGWYLALNHVFWATVLALTIIGIPFAVQHVKLAALSLAPVGTEIVPWRAPLPASPARAASENARLRERVERKDQPGSESE